MSEVSMLLPKSDVIFKLFFSDERNIDLLKDFLKSILDLPDDEYNEITVIDPHLLREHPADKLGILDVKLTSKTGKILHLEMQVLPIPNMESRVVFYQAKMIVEQIGDGDDYEKINRVISIVITDYDFIKGDSVYHHRFIQYDPKNNVTFTDLTETHVLELSKLPKNFDGSALCDWLKFLAAESKEEFDMVASRNPQIEQAVARLKVLSSDERARMLYEAQVKERRDNRAREKGAIKSREFEFARKLLSRGRPTEEIVEDTGLTYAEVEGLRNSI